MHFNSAMLLSHLIKIRWNVSEMWEGADCQYTISLRKECPVCENLIGRDPQVYHPNHTSHITGISFIIQQRNCKYIFVFAFLTEPAK
jgi:hypothetical protein